MSQLNVPFTFIAIVAALMLISGNIAAQDQSAPVSNVPKAETKASKETVDVKPVAEAPRAESTKATAVVNDSEQSEAAATSAEDGNAGVAEAAAAAASDAAEPDKSSEPATTDAKAGAAESADGTKEAVKTTPREKRADETNSSKAESAAGAPSGKRAGVQVKINADALAPPKRPDNFVSKSVPRTDRIVNIHTAQTVRPGAMTLTIDHRAYETFLSGEDAWFDYLGLDSGNLKIGIGLRLGLKDYMDVGFYRLNNGTDLFDVYEFDTKMRFLEQDTGFVNMSLRIGASWFVQKDAEDAAGFFSQVNVDRRLFGTLLVGTGFAFHTDSTNDHKHYEDVDQSAAVLGYVEWRPVRVFSLNGEMAAAVAGYNSKYPVFAFSARFLTHRHSFQVLVANSQQMSADGIVTNAWRGFGHLLFGFQIVREFQLKK